MTKMTQAEQIKTFLSQNDYKSALKVASKSRYTKGNLHKIKSAYEMMIYPEFYKQLKLNIDSEIQVGINELKLHYGN